MEADGGPATVEEVVVERDEDEDEDEDDGPTVAFFWISYCKPTLTRFFTVVMHVSGLW